MVVHGYRLWPDLHTSDRVQNLLRPLHTFQLNSRQAGMKSSGKEGSSIHTDSLSVGVEERKEGEGRGVRASVPVVSTGTR